MPNKEAKINLDPAQATGVSEIPTEETEQEETRKGNWREVFRTAFERARRQQKPAAGRQELGRDKSKAFFLLVAIVVAVLLLFFGIFSTPQEAYLASRRDAAWPTQPRTQGNSRTGKYGCRESHDSYAERGYSLK